jgi:IclR family transcriptional regulator, acetate operon repressor
MRMFTEVGRRLLAHGVGVGKAMLSQLPASEVRDLLQRTGMPAYTPHTHTDPEQLIAHLDEIAARGYALDESEQELGVRCIAVPVTGASVPSALSVSGPEGRLTSEAAARIAPAVGDVAARLSKRLHDEGLGVTAGVVAH